MEYKEFTQNLQKEINTKTPSVQVKRKNENNLLKQNNCFIIFQENEIQKAEAPKLIKNMLLLKKTIYLIVQRLKIKTKMKKRKMHFLDG